MLMLNLLTTTNPMRRMQRKLGMPINRSLDELSSILDILSDACNVKDTGMILIQTIRNDVEKIIKSIPEGKVKEEVISIAYDTSKLGFTGARA